VSQPARHEFVLPADTGAGALVARLSEALPYAVSEEPARNAALTLLDTFDWRVFEDGGFLELEATGRGRRLTWWSADGGEVRGQAKVTVEPRFAWDLPAGRLREDLAPVLDVRALLPIVSLRSRLRPLELRNADGKTIVRLRVEEHRILGPGHTPRGWLRRLRILPVRGYEEQAGEVAEVARSALGLPPAQEPAYLSALTAAGRHPRDYNPRLDFELSPEARADAALQVVLQRLLETLQANEDGVRRHLDTEFLHDFRVAVRRARSALAQLKRVFPRRTVDGLRRGLGWVGRRTNAARDMDVYLLAFPVYQGRLPAGQQPHLEPFRTFLLEHQARAYHSLGAMLDSARYRRLTRTWRGLATRRPPRRPSAPDAALPIGRVARKRTWAAYRRVMRRGQAVRPRSPATDLHQVRIACKRLRYLMEFFRSLFPPEEIGLLIRALKSFQDNLGEFQDLEVQCEQLRRFEGEMARAGSLAPETRTAMERLVEDLTARQAEVRAEFAARFEAFSAPEVRGEFRRLFRTPRGKEAKP
jgi:CHAD domain-containing protein